MTEYVVLRKTSEEWEEVRKIGARSARSAVRQIVDGTGSGEGEYVAVPVRSWQPVQVAIETQTKLKFS